MSAKQDVEFKVGATDNASSTFAKIGRAMKDMTKDAKAAAGEESAFGQIGKVLAGAGIVAGLALVGRQLAATTEKAVELKNAFNEGRMSLGEIAEEAAKSIPVIGSFVSAGRNIREFFTGEIAQATEELKKFNDEAGKLNKTNDRDNQTRKDIAGRGTQLAREKAMALAGSDSERQKLQADNDLQDRLAEIAKRRGEFLGGSGQRKEQLDALEKQEREMHAIRIKLIQDEVDAKSKAEREKFEEDRQQKIQAATEDARKVAEKQAADEARRKELRRGFAEEDRVDALGGERASLQSQIAQMESRRPRSGAVAESITDVGRGAILASMERRSADPGVKVLTEQKRRLEEIDKTLKAIAEEQKRRNRMNQLGEDPIF